MKQEAQPAPWCLFLSIFHLFFFFFIRDIKIIQNPHFIRMTAHCFLPFFFFICPLFFLAHSAESSGQSRDLWLAIQWRGYFLRNLFCQPLSSLVLHMLTWANIIWITAERDFGLGRLCSSVTWSWTQMQKSVEKCQRKEIFLFNVAVFWLGLVLVWRNGPWIPDHASAKSAIKLQRTL